MCHAHRAPAQTTETRRLLVPTFPRSHRSPMGGHTPAESAPPTHRKTRRRVQCRLPPRGRAPTASASRDGAPTAALLYPAPQSLPGAARSQRKPCPTCDNCSSWVRAAPLAGRGPERPNTGRRSRARQQEDPPTSAITDPSGPPVRTQPLPRRPCVRCSASKARATNGPGHSWDPTPGPG